MKNKPKSKKHKSKQNIWRYFISVFSTLAIVGLIFGLAVDYNYPKWIFIAGSSTMQPLLERISMIYSDAEISANSGGSSYGITSVVQNKKNIGMVSKQPSTSIAGLPGSNIVGEYQDAWKNNKIKTVTIAKDAIGIVYKANDDLVITNDNIIDLYKIFCGETIKFNQLVQQSNDTKSFIAFARSGGAKESGTAEAFIENNNLPAGAKEKLKNSFIGSDSIWDILSNGKYKANVQQTNESNFETWEVLKNYTGNSIPITYLSAGFIRSNYNEITNAGYKIAGYGDDNASLLLANNNINEAYNWYRPLNLVLKTNNIGNNPAIYNFIQWLIGNTLFANSLVLQEYDRIGFIAPNVSTLNTMFNINPTIINQIANYAKANPNKSYNDFLKENKSQDIFMADGRWNGFWISDYQLYEEQKNERDQTKVYYGAIFQ